MAINMTISNKGIPGFGEVGMVILKTYIYRKHWGYQDNKTGEIIEGDKYMTLFSLIPSVEFRSSIEMKDGCPRSEGTFVKVIGSTEGLIITPYRVGLATYQNHLELNGWKFVQTVPGAKGGDYDTVRKHAYSLIKNLEKAHEEVEKVYKKRESIRDLVRLTREKVGSKSTVLPYLRQIEDIVNN